MRKTAQNILDYIQEKGQVTANELVEHLSISRQALFKHHLSKMIHDGVLMKIGRPPKVFYSLHESIKTIDTNILLDAKTKRVLDENYLIITPAGEKKEGTIGFAYWCEKQGLPLRKTASEYVTTLHKYDRFRKNELIDGLAKLKRSFDRVYLDRLYYLSLYSIERFGKTKLGQLLLYAKQSQNRMLMAQIVQEANPGVRKIVKEFKIDGIGFIPPTVKRDVQLMKVLEKKLGENIRRLKISKVKTVVTVPQKTLNKLEDRIENARKTIVVEENSGFHNILLIDDAVGSGSTLNETAKKIKDKKLCTGKIIGLSITGSFKGFDVISEV
jgi:hypothetical protein